MSLKSNIRRWIPEYLLEWHRRRRKNARMLFDSSRTTEEVFTDIYLNNRWGGKPGEFSSGGGSHEEAVADAYCGLITAHSRRFGFGRMAFVDLGCGDMRIGSRLVPLCNSYTGVDVVKILIEHHRTELGGDSVRFAYLDIIRDELPDGDVCFIRQVLQHLSNDQILKILPKLRKYRYVYITEHIPSANAAFIPNRDKPHGGGIRLDEGSGVVVTSGPFNLPNEEVTVVLEVEGNRFKGCNDPGLIQTLLYTPGKSAAACELETVGKPA